MTVVLRTSFQHMIARMESPMAAILKVHWYSLGLTFLLVLLPMVHAAKTFPPRRPGRWAPSIHEAQPPFTISNMTCEFFEQPLNHFDLPRNSSGFFRQRFCYYNEFVQSHDNLHQAPVFLYTGNESPLEEYINHTGLIWESAPHFHAQVIFVEHRYEGQSFPDPDMPNCLAYAASYQALADFANFIENYIFRIGTQGHHRRPVIVFGGSYGGMLSAWMRMLYPHLVAGAIAGSAPIGGFPTNRPNSIDAAYTVIRHGLQQSYPPTIEPTIENHCSDNLLATWPLIRILSQEETGRKLLQETFRLCHLPPSDGQILISWAQSPWFDMAEGSFPYPSSYITFALTHRPVKLPAWPLQAACWNQSALYKDWQISFTGNQTDVLYNISYGDSGLSIAVNWDTATPIMPCESCWDSVHGSESVRGLLESVRDAVSVWFNVTKDVKCYNLTVAPNSLVSLSTDLNEKVTTQRNLRTSDSRASEQCAQRMAQGSWPSLCCNEEMNLIITDASGLGNDSFWPPAFPRGTKSYSDVYPHWSGIAEECTDPDGIFGFPQSMPDPFARYMDIRYGGLHLLGHSNIVFGNGLLDPWSAAGVYGKGGDPAQRRSTDDENRDTHPQWQPYQGTPGLYVQNITEDDRMIALVIAVGGHHTDLMYSNPADPPSVRMARQIQRDYIHRWIGEFWNQEEVTF